MGGVFIILNSKTKNGESENAEKQRMGIGNENRKWKRVMGTGSENEECELRM